MYLKQDAIFVADTHYNKKNLKFEFLLDDILSNKIQTSQLILLGDIFDYLSFEIEYFKNINKKVIDKLNILSSKLEIIYLEGNHDYNLKKLFPNITIIPRQKQPLICNYNNKKISLAHGDIFMTWNYEFFTKFIRNKFVLNIINFLDINNFFTRYIENMLLNKDIYSYKFKDFNSFAQNRINLYKKYNVDMIIEGHFHQNKKYNNYINILYIMNIFEKYHL